LLRDKRPILEKLVTVLMEVETLEGETLKRLLGSDPNEPWPPSDLQQSEPPAATPTETAPPRQAYEPKPPSGLAWEGGSQSRTDVS
jgi:hypothetical protein